jgi:hypothetical protein
MYEENLSKADLLAIMRNPKKDSVSRAQALDILLDRHANTDAEKAALVKEAQSYGNDFVGLIAVYLSEDAGISVASDQKMNVRLH